MIIIILITLYYIIQLTCVDSKANVNQYRIYTINNEYKYYSFNK